MTHMPIWMHVSSGKRIDVSRPNLEEIDIEDIAWSLSHMFRFNGHLRYPITVARHSVYVAELLQEPLRLAGLLHDAHEAYLGDTVRPVKRYLRLSGVDLDDLEGYWQHQIWKKYGCAPMAAVDENKIVEADDLQLAREMVSYAAEGSFQETGREWLKTSGYSEISLLLPHPPDPRGDYELFKSKFFEYYSLDHQAESM